MFIDPIRTRPASVNRSLPLAHLQRGTTRSVIRRSVNSLRMQLSVLLTLGVGVPVLVRHGIPNEQLLASGPFLYSVLGAIAAAIAGLLISRRVSAFPGTSSVSLVLPSYAMAFGITGMVLLALRLDYSASLLLLIFTASVVVGFALVYLRNTGDGHRFYLVPNGNHDIVHELPDLNWAMLTEPSLPRHPEAVIVVDLRAEHGFEWEQMLAQAALAGIPVYHSKNVRESLTGRVHIEHLSENHLGSLSPNVAYRKFKRLFDLVLCLATLPVVLPVMLAAAIAIKLDSRGAVFFVQQRIGYGGAPFRVFKFRTMHIRGQVNGDEAVVDAVTLAGDARITRVGRFLRTSRIDELPQIVNVLRGQMSWIGPRPEAMPLSEWYSSEIPFYAYRHIVRPGVSGWAQVNQGHVADLADVHLKLHYDFYYIKNFSLWLDLLITLRTITTMMTGFGAR